MFNPFKRRASSSTTADARFKRSMSAVIQPPNKFIDLPSETLQQVLGYLTAVELLAVSQTCRHLNATSNLDVLWVPFLKAELPECDFPQELPDSVPSYRHLYLAHHPHWFLTRNRLWFSSDPYNGKLIVCKYNATRQSIEGYRVVARQSYQPATRWSYKANVQIHNATFTTFLSTSAPVLSLVPDAAPRKPQAMPHVGDGKWWQDGEYEMRVGHSEHRIHSSFFLARNLPVSTAEVPSVDVWPPRIIPRMPRVRASSGDKFIGRGHKPQTLSDISQTAFRTRMWSQWLQSVRSMGVRAIDGTEVATWSTLDPVLYTPTAKKPYQGIFVGDYASHGCEFLLVMQTDPDQPPRAPSPVRRQDRARMTRDAIQALHGQDTAEATDDLEGFNFLLAQLIGGGLQQHLMGEDSDDEGADTVAAQIAATSVQHPQRPATPNINDDEIHQGGIEAIKLTGDVNVPRGEHTFIAEDIGEAGLVRIAHEAPFRGARVVRSRGHVAAMHFQNDQFVSSELFLISPDVLAQYWLPFHHISFYRRVDLDALLTSTEPDLHGQPSSDDDNDDDE